MLIWCIRIKNINNKNSYVKNKNISVILYFKYYFNMLHILYLYICTYYYNNNLIMHNYMQVTLNQTLILTYKYM